VDSQVLTPFVHLVDSQVLTPFFAGARRGGGRS
jgi:hypothetical protein